MTRGLQLAALLAAVGAAACTTPRTEPALGGSEGAERSAEDAAEDRYTVSLGVDPGTPREEVESALLYRAAQVAARRGSPYFALVEAETEGQVEAETVYPAYGRVGRLGPALGVAADFSYPYRTGWDYGSVESPGPVAPVGPVGPLGAPDRAPGMVVEPEILEASPFDASVTVELLDARPSGRDDVLETERVLATLEPLSGA